MQLDSTRPEKVAPFPPRSRRRTLASTYITLHPSGGYPDKLFIAPSEIRAFHEEVDTTHLFGGTHIRRTRVFPRTEMGSRSDFNYLSHKEGFAVEETPEQITAMLRGESIA